MALLSALKQIASIEAGPLSEALKTELFKLVIGTLSLPINFPGTNYHSGVQVKFNPRAPLEFAHWLCHLEYIAAHESLSQKKKRKEYIADGLISVQARKKLVGMLRDIIEERRASRCPHNDMLDSLLTIDENAKLKLSDEQIIDLIIALVYSGYETVSTTSMMAVKYLYDHPKALEELRVRNHSDTIQSKDAFQFLNSFRV